MAEKDIKDELFDSTKALQPMILNYLDLPYIFGPTKDGFNFIYALEAMENLDLDIFGLKSVQIIIDQQLKKWDNV